MISTRILRMITPAMTMLTLAGCLEIETTTTVRPDGSIRREVRTHGDSAEVSNDHGLFFADSAWTSVGRRMDSTYERVTSREFGDARTFQKALDLGGDRALRVRVSLERHFAWFTTTFEFRETILCYNQIHAVPLDAFIPAADQDAVILHEFDKVPYASTADSARLSAFAGRLEEWDHRNKFEEYHQRFADGAHWLQDAALTARLTPAAKESLYVRTMSALNEGKLDTLPGIYATVLQVPAVQRVFAKERRRFEDFDRALNTQETMLTSGYKKAAIVMPGILTGTNARTVEAGRVVWEDPLLPAYVKDHTMWARSRVINWWAVVLTGGIVLVLAMIPLAALVRDRRRVRLNV